MHCVWSGHVATGRQGNHRQSVQQGAPIKNRQSENPGDLGHAGNTQTKACIVLVWAISNWALGLWQLVNSLVIAVSLRFIVLRFDGSGVVEQENFLQIFIKSLC